MKDTLNPALACQFHMADQNTEQPECVFQSSLIVILILSSVYSFCLSVHQVNTLFCISHHAQRQKGAIPEALCVQLLHRYEDERLEKLEQKADLTAKIEAMEQAESGADEWISMIQDYSHLETLDRPTLLRLINRIEVGERKMLNGQDEREIKIYYNFVGFVEV